MSVRSALVLSLALSLLFGAACEPKQAPAAKPASPDASAPATSSPSLPPDAPSVTDAARDFVMALLEDGDRYKQFVLTDAEVTTHFGAEIGKVMNNARSGAFIAGRDELKRWVSGQPMQIGEITTKGVTPASEKFPAKVETIFVPYRAGAIQGKVTVNGALLKPEGWRFITFQFSRDRTLRP